jgi:hypothetical protein
MFYWKEKVAFFFKGVWLDIKKHLREDHSAILLRIPVAFPDHAFVFGTWSREKMHQLKVLWQQYLAVSESPQGQVTVRKYFRGERSAWKDWNTRRMVHTMYRIGMSQLQKLNVFSH